MKKKHKIKNNQEYSGEGDVNISLQSSVINSYTLDRKHVKKLNLYQNDGTRKVRRRKGTVHEIRSDVSSMVDCQWTGITVY